MSVKMAKDNMNNAVTEGGRIIMTRSRKAADDQVQAVLHTFTFELPDPHQELFFQCPSTFPLFPKIPLEIRRLIWKETFPQTRHVRCCDNIAPPISAHINQESRTETLQHYAMLLPDSMVSGILRSANPASMRKQPPIFWNGERDVLSLRSPCIFYLSAIPPILDARLIETDYEKFWGRHFTNDRQSFLASVRTLELHMRGWDNEWKRWLGNGPFCRLKNFVGLKELRVLDVSLAEEHALLTASRTRDCVDTLTGIFRDLAAANPEISRPTIVIMKEKLPIYGPGY